MRVALALGALCCISCTVVFRREHDQCQTSADCQSLTAGSVCTESGICEQLVDTASLPGEPQACQRDADCTDDAWAICRDGTCRALDTDGCVALSPGSGRGTRDRLPLAVLVPAVELTSGRRGPNLEAASIAVAALSDAFIDPLPAIVAVACDENDAAARAHLLGSEVRVVIGPMQADAIDAVRVAIDGRAVLFSPYADAPELETAGASATTSIVSCKPNRNGSKASLLSAANAVQAELRRRKLIAAGSRGVLALSDVDAGFEFSNAELSAASLDRTSYSSDPTGQGLVSALKGQGSLPGLLVAASAVDDWSLNIEAVDDAAKFGGRPYPFYLLADKQATIFRLVRQVNASDHPVYLRAVGLEYSLSKDNLAVHGEFQRAFMQNAGLGFEPGLDYVRDCVYLAAYAAIAGQFRFSLTSGQLSPTSILVGLRAFSEGGRQLTTKSSDIGWVLNELRIDRGDDASVSLVGGSGNLDLFGLLSVQEIAAAPAAQYVRPRSRAQRLYCIDPIAGFVDTQVEFPSSGATPGAELSDALGCLQGAAQ